MNGELDGRNISGERRDQYGPRGIKNERLNQRADDLRRHLILKYAVHPDQKEKGELPRDLWQEEVDDLLAKIGAGQDKIGADAGTSSGYWPELLYKSGYQGALLACDYHVSHMQSVYERIKPLAGDADFRVGRADAEKMNEARLIDGQRIEIPDDYFDFYALNNVVHHTADPVSAMAESARVTKKGGYVYFMGRAKEHFANIYEILRLTANFYHATTPKPFYSHCDMFRMKEIIMDTPGLKIVREVPQAEYAWVPMTDEGWSDYAETIYTHLPLMKSRRTGRRLRRSEAADYIEGPVKKSWFKHHASYTEGYITDYVFQTLIVCEVDK